jgi:hypothetical protein
VMNASPSPFSPFIFEHFDQHPAFNLFEAACLSELHARQSDRRVPSKAPLIRTESCENLRTWNS